MQSLIDKSETPVKVEVDTEKVRKISEQISKCDQSLTSYGGILESEVTTTLEMQVEANDEMQTLLA